MHILLFLSAYLGSLITSLVKYPIYAFVAYQVVYFFHPLSRWWGSSLPKVSYSFIAVIVMLVVLVFRYKDLNSNRVFQIPAFRWMYLLLIIFCLVSFNAVFPILHSVAMEQFIKLVVTMTVAFKLCNSVKDLNAILWGYIGSASYIAFYAFQTGRNSGGRVEGIGMVDSPDANGLAAGIAPTLVLALYSFWISKNNGHRLIIAVLGAFLANSIVLIASRGAFLAVVAGVGYFMLHMYFSKFQRKNQKKVAVFLTIIGMVGALSLVDKAFIERIYTMKTGTEINAEKESGSTRFVFWDVAIDIAAEHPFGRGVHTFNFYSDAFLPHDIHTGDSRSRTVHSTWFEALTEVGYIGALVFVLMLYSCFSMTKKVKNKLAGIGAIDDYFKVIAIEGALISYMVAMTFLNRLRAENLYWCILFIACAYNVYYLKKYVYKAEN